MNRWIAACTCLALGGAIGIGSRTAFLQGQNTSQSVFAKEAGSYRQVVKRVLPAVVSIEARPPTGTERTKQGQGQRRAIPEQFRRLFPDLDEFGDFGMQDEPFRRAFGSGFIVDPKGVVVTNYHVVAGADRVEITLSDGRKFTSRDFKGDRKNDLAIIRFDSKSPLPFLEFGDSDAMEIGDRVLAAGAPFGLTGSVSSGIVSAKGRSGISGERTVYEDFIQTDAAINPGNSGGPLVNLEGKVIGISTAIKTRNGGFQGVSLAITSNVARNIVDQLIRDGIVRRGYLGVQVKAIEPEVAAQLGLKANTGLEVVQVYEKTPAAKAGIKPGDILSSVAGQPVNDSRELQRIVGTLPLKKPIPATVIQEGKTRNLTVVIEQQPDDYGTVQASRPARGRPREEVEETRVGKLGMSLTDLTADLAAQLGYSEDKKGVLIVGVEQGGLAEAAGLRDGMLIIRVSRKPVSSATIAKEALEKAPLDTGVLLQVERSPRMGGGTYYIVVRASESDK